ncbi:MAG: BrnA antitoxin family protein [Duganella sp.]
MNAKPKTFPETWVDPDDAPELTDDFFENAVWSIGDRGVSRSEAQAEAALRRGRPLGSGTKVSTTIRFDAEVLAGFKATGRGWQTRMNDVLREWLNSKAATPTNQDL